MPRKAREGFEWVSSYVPIQVYRTLIDIARAEGRTKSVMAWRLMAEAMKARGHDVDADFPDPTRGAPPSAPPN